MMLSPGAVMSGQVWGLAAAPRDDVVDTVPSRVPVPPSSYEATVSTPGVGSSEALGLELLVVPSPPWLPLAQTVSTPAAASRSSSVVMTGSLAPQEQLSTRIGGHVAAGTPSPHGAAWCCSTQANEFWMAISVAVAEIITTRAPGATPPTLVPSPRVYEFPTATPETMVPWPPWPVSLSTVAGRSAMQDASVGAVYSWAMQGSEDRLRTSLVEPSGRAKAGWVGSMPVSMMAIEVPRPSSCAPPASWSWARAASTRIAAVPVVLGPP